MVEAENVRVQRETAERIGARTVRRVARDRMADAGEMHANLISSSGLEPNLEERVARTGADDAPVRHRGPSASGIARLAHAPGDVVEEPAPRRARRLRGAPLDQREVRPLDGVRRELRL